MAVLSPKMRSVKTGFAHWCPGCESMHILPAGRGWSYLALDTMQPSARPSFKHTWGNGRCCHYILKKGVLQFCDDCTHPMASKNITLPDIPRQILLGTDGNE